MDLLGALGEADQPTKPREKEAHVDDARLRIGVSLEKLSVTGGGVSAENWSRPGITL